MPPSLSQRPPLPLAHHPSPSPRRASGASHTRTSHSARSRLPCRVPRLSSCRGVFRATSLSCIHAVSRPGGAFGCRSCTRVHIRRRRRRGRGDRQRERAASPGRGSRGPAGSRARRSHRDGSIRAVRDSRGRRRKLRGACASRRLSPGDEDARHRRQGRRDPELSPRLGTDRAGGSLGPGARRGRRRSRTGNQVFKQNDFHGAPTITTSQIIQQSIAGAARAPTGEVHIRGQHAEYTYYIDGVPGAGRDLRAA